MEWRTVFLVAVIVAAVIMIMRRGKAPADSSPMVESLSDPREAAAIILVQLAAYQGHMRLDHKAAIMEEMQMAFQASADEAEGLFSFGRMAVGQMGDIFPSLKRLLRPIESHCSPAEREEFFGMMERVIDVDQTPDPMQKRLVEATRKCLLTTS